MCSVSIIVPVYNDEEYLKATIESVYSQKECTMEVIAVDDGSTDNSLSVLKDLQKKYPSMIVITQSNRGPGGARNRGLQEANGEYIYFLDGDDLIDQDLVRFCIQKIRENKCDVVGFEADIFGNIADRDEKQYIYDYRCADIGKVIGGIQFFLRNHEKIAMLNTPLLFFKKSFLLSNRLYFMENVLYEDMAFYYQMMALDPEIIIIDKILYHRRYRNNSVMTSEMSERKIFDRIKVYLTIGEIDNYLLKRIYCYDTLYEIRKSLEKIETLNIHINESLKKQVCLYIEKLESSNFELNLLSMFELYLCYKYLKLYSSNLMNVIRNKIILIDEKLGLYNKDNCIGIYGIGEMSDLFIRVCVEIMGEFVAEVIYIDTYAKTGKKTYKHQPVVNYQEVDFNKLSAVLIASPRYENEIYNNIMKVSKSAEIYRLSMW